MKFPTVQQLAMRQENDQRVYFTEDTARDQASGNPPKTEFFALCQVDNFSETLLYADVPEYYTWNNKSWQRTKQEMDVAGYPGVKHTQAEFTLSAQVKETVSIFVCSYITLRALNRLLT